MNTHKDCEFYVKEKDMCLLYIEYGFHNVSQYHECLENMVFNDSNKKQKEELLKLLKENRNEMNQLQSELRTISSRLYVATRNYESIETVVKRVLNTEEHGNRHLNCKYYKKDSDTCYNYLMGVYTGLAFEVSRLDKCIGDVIKEQEK